MVTNKHRNTCYTSSVLHGSTKRGHLLMSNLTITSDDEVLEKARIRALREGTSVNAVLREFLESYAGIRNEQMAAVRELLDASQKATSRSGGRSWTRDELHERS